MRLRAAHVLTGLTVATGTLTMLATHGMMQGLLSSREQYMRGLGRPDVVALEPLAGYVGDSPGLRIDDYLRLREAFPESTPYVYMDWLPIRSEQGVINAKTAGVAPETFELFDYPLRAGTYFTTRHVAEHARVALLGSAIAEELFGRRDPVGSLVSLHGHSFQVLGVFAMDWNDYVQNARKFGSLGDGGGNSLMLRWRGFLLPYTTAGELQQSYRMHALYVDTTNPGRLEAAVRHLHQAPDFTVRTQGDAFAQFARHARNLGAVTYLLSLLGVLMSSMGIFSVGMADVRRQRHELGILRALGAPARWVFLRCFQTTVVLTAGGLAAGLALYYPLQVYFQTLGHPMQLAAGAIACDLGIISVVSLATGVFPARSATRSSITQAICT